MIRERLIATRKDISDSAALLPSPLAQPLWLVSDDLAQILAELDACELSYRHNADGKAVWHRLVPDQ